ncbi:MAG TPA: tetratricopeptide repeat protein, partial [Flavisolibacter sp.]|nr:tetratricopeptide repeat protein [Flavisolibacter sp.]
MRKHPIESNCITYKIQGMQKSIYSLIACVFFISLFATAQCPDQAVLYKRLTFLDESTTPVSQKLEELQGYLSRMNTCPYKNDSTHVFLLSCLAGVYQQEEDYTKAIHYRRQAIDMIAANASKPSANLTSLPIQYYRLSLSYDSLGNFSEKMKALDSCSAIAMRLNYVDRASLTAIFTFILYYFDIGDYKRCIDYALRCQSLGEQYKINNTAEEQLVGDMYVSSAFVWQVIALMKLKNFTEAEKLLVNKVEAFKKAGLTIYLCTTYSQLAEVQLNKNNIEKAHSYYKLALKYDQKAGFAFSCKQTLKDIGYTIYYSHFNDN